jgi:hypothetical protein
MNFNSKKMNLSNKKPEKDTSKVEEPSIVYQIKDVAYITPDNPAFDFDAEWEKGYTPDEFKAEMFKRIAAYPWKK